MRHLLSAALAACLALLQAPAYAQAMPANLDFEHGVAGQAPPGWTTENLGYATVLDRDAPQSGAMSARLHRNRPPTPGESKVGVLASLSDAAPYRGERVRFRVAVRTAPGAKAYLWLRVDRQRGQKGAYVRSPDISGTADGWIFYEIDAPVARNAERLAFGLVLASGDAVGLDSASLTLVPTATAGNEAPRPLTAQGRRNLEAFARLYGYVRWFYPSQAIAKADWNSLAIAGVQRVESARNGAELAAALREIFLPLAPTLVIDPGSGPQQPIPGDNLLAWRHASFQAPMHDLYRSELLPLPAGRDPGETVTLDLGQGVSARMRLALPASAGAVTRSPLKPDKPPSFSPTGADRATRLAAVVVAWNVPQHFYAYFDTVKVDWQAQLGPTLTAAATDKDPDAFLETLQRMMAALKDGHANAWMNDGPPRAMLPMTWNWVEGQLTVLGVKPGFTGLARGDVVLRIDGREPSRFMADYEALISSATPQLLRQRAAEKSLIGPPGAPLTLRVRRADGREADFTLSYSEKFEPGPAAEDRPAPVAELQPGLMYVDLTRVDGKAYDQSLPRLIDAKAVIFDMRGYPRPGLWPVLMDSLSAKSIPSQDWNTPIFTRPDRKGMTFVTTNTPTNPAAQTVKGKLVFLTNAEAISQAEALLGYVEDNHLGAIVGEATAGTNGDITNAGLPGGYVIIMTGMNVTKHGGGAFHGVGILPTIQADRTLAGVSAGRDELLEAGLKAAGF